MKGTNDVWNMCIAAEARNENWHAHSDFFEYLMLR